MFRRRCAALGYPNPNFNEKDVQEFRNLVVWLEDIKIKKLKKLSQGNGLRETNDEAWNQHYQAYLNELRCPTAFLADDNQSLCWLLGEALMVEDNAYELSSNLAESDNFVENVNKLSSLLQIPPHHDPQVRLEACCKLLKNLAESEKAKKKPASKTIKINLSEHSFGIANIDSKLVEAVKILRLLHLVNLRKLQSNINNTIELVQEVTADPKTDVKLGKVGR